jgi:hypothetical protein
MNDEPWVSTLGTASKPPISPGHGAQPAFSSVSHLTA